MTTDAHKLARTTDPETSKQAAETAAQRAPSVRAAVYQLLEEFGPLTDNEIATRYMALRDLYRFPLTTESSLRTRRKELQRDRLVELVPNHTRRTRSGHMARVWTVTASTKIRSGGRRHADISD